MNNINGTNTLVGHNFAQAGSPYNIIWTATDAEGNNTSNCFFSLTILDVTAPSVVSSIPSKRSCVSTFLLGKYCTWLMFSKRDLVSPKPAHPYCYGL